MKSIISTIAVALLGGVLAGAALGYWEARPWMAAKPGAAGAPPAKSIAKMGDKVPAAPDSKNLAKGPAAAIPEVTYNFGNMEMNTKKHHLFPIKNGGDAPLRVTFVTHTCKCTKVMLADKEVDVDDFVDIPPGGEGQVELEWTAKVAPGPFRHGATFTTSDPQQSRIEFTVEGEIVGTDTVEPTQFTFGALHAGDKGEAFLHVMSFLDDNVKIDSAEVVEPELAKRLSVRVEEATKASLPNATATSGAKVVAVYDAGGSIGPFGGSIRLKTNLKKSPVLEIPVSGTVKGDLSLYGRGWNELAGLLRMEPMASSTGGKAQLNITIRGEHVAETKLAIKSVKPEELKVTLGDRKELGPRLAQQRITFEIPAGSRPMVMAGEDQGGEGEVILSTGHPITPELKLRVQFTVSP